jgi:hypothetical protein
MLGDTHAHALQNRDDGLVRLVRGEACWPSLRFKREETKFPDGSRRFFNGSARWLHVGRCVLTVLARRSAGIFSQQQVGRNDRRNRGQW